MSEIQPYNGGNNQLSIRPDIKELGRSLLEYSNVIAFDLTDIRLISYTNDVKRLYPWVTPRIMSVIIDEMKMGKHDIVSSLGFPNIAKAIEGYGGRLCYIYHEDSKKFLKATFQKWHTDFESNPEFKCIPKESWDTRIELPTMYYKYLSAEEREEFDRKYKGLYRECKIPGYSPYRTTKL